MQVLTSNLKLLKKFHIQKCTGSQFPLAQSQFNTLTFSLIRTIYLPIMRVMQPDGYGHGKMAGVKWCLQPATVRHVSWCTRDAMHSDGDGNKNQVRQCELYSCSLTGIDCMRDEHLHQCGAVVHLRLAEGVSHFFVFDSFHKNPPLFFLEQLYFFRFTLPCSLLLFFCGVSTLRGFTQRNQFCLASLPMEYI